MATEVEVVPVRGWVDINENGQTRRIEFGDAEAIERAAETYPQNILSNLVVLFSDDSEARPFRFCPTQIDLREEYDEDGGLHVSF